jgi:subtilisin family serine protease
MRTVKRGVVTVWALGNDGGDGSAAVSNPPGMDPTPGIVSVASYFDRNTGTSMATPHIAGIVAQLFRAKPSATPAQVEAAIESTAYQYTDGAPYENGTNGTTSFDEGHGLVDVVAAATALR